MSVYWDFKGFYFIYEIQAYLAWVLNIYMYIKNLRYSVRILIMLQNMVAQLRSFNYA